MLFSIWFFKFCTWYCYTLSSLFLFNICPLCLFTTVVCLFYVYNKLHKIYLYFTALENHPNQSKVRTLQIELLKSIGEIVFISQRKKKKYISQCQIFPLSFSPSLQFCWSWWCQKDAALFHHTNSCSVQSNETQHIKASLVFPSKSKQKLKVCDVISMATRVLIYVTR